MTSRKRELVEAWFRGLWGERREELIEQMVDPDCVIHGLPEVSQRGPAAFRPFYEVFGKYFALVDVRIEHHIEEGDWIAWRASARVRDQTGREAAFACGAMVRWNDEGRMVEVWNQLDFLSLFLQLGLIEENSLRGILMP